MDSARAAGAPDYAIEEWAKLEVAFDRAKEELANQEKMLAIFRSYGKVDEMLKRVAEDAVRVGALAAEKRVEMRAAAENTEREARDVLVSAEELLLRVTSRRNRTATKDIRNELTALNDSLSAVHRLIEEGNFAPAQSQAQMLKDKAASTIEKIQETAGGRIRHAKG
jgi:replicative DNA helicase